MWQFPCARAVGTFALFALLAGCSNRLRTAPVRGTVEYKGKAVPSGTVNFFPADGPAASGEIQPDGTYKLTTYQPGDGAVPGAYKVVIVAMADQTGLLPEQRNPLPASIVPEKYTSIATSPLKAEVKDGENVFDFKLTAGK